MTDFNAKSHHSLNESDISLGLTTLSNNTAHKLLILLKTNPKELTYMLEYLNNLSDWKNAENDIDWVNFELSMAQHYSCQIKEINNIMIELYKSGKFTEICKDYSLYKGLGTYQRMVSN